MCLKMFMEKENVHSKKYKSRKTIKSEILYEKHGY